MALTMVVLNRPDDPHFEGDNGRLYWRQNDAVWFYH